MADIHDFGEKIGGARKDVWKLRGLNLDDFDTMGELERKSTVKKDNIWIRPNWEEVIKEGTPQSVAYWQNLMRQSIPPRPNSLDEEVQKNYVKIVGELRDAVMEVRDPDKINSFYKDFILPNYVESNSSYYVTLIPEVRGVINNKVLKAAKENSYRMRDEAEEKLFGIPKDEQYYTKVKQNMHVYKYDGVSVSIAPIRNNENDTKVTVKDSFGSTFYYLYELHNDKFRDRSLWEKGTYIVVDDLNRKIAQINLKTREEAEAMIESVAIMTQEKMTALDEAEKANNSKQKRKGAFVPPQLKNIDRTGPDYRHGFEAETDMYLDDLKFRAGEFGNWLNNNDRQVSLNMGYDAFRDLARVLEIRPEDVSLNNSLAIAFGARGTGGANAARAHYEPALQVINLTKMSGAGCLAHEWAHALDHAIGLSLESTELATEITGKGKAGIPESMLDIISSMRYKTILADADDLKENYQKKVAHAERNLTNWIKDITPRNMPEKYAKEWEEAVKVLKENAHTATGGEYFRFHRNDDVLTNEYVENLSLLRKKLTNHAIPMDKKYQITAWMRTFTEKKAELKDIKPQEIQVKTDFYEGSLKFDAQFSRSSHGYWASQCEMFARAFDCYIADKLKDSGVKSQYLTAYADSFTLTDPKTGEFVAAIPLGDERKLLNEKFDQLIKEVKELGILHHFVEEIELPKEEKRKSPEEILAKHRNIEAPVHTEQLSLDDLLFNASMRSGANQAKEHTAYEIER